MFNNPKSSKSDKRPIQVLALIFLVALLVAPFLHQYVNAVLFGYDNDLAMAAQASFDRQLPYVVGGLLTVIVGDTVNKIMPKKEVEPNDR